MKRLSATLILSACFASAALAQAPGVPAEFVLTVCNKSNELALAAVGARVPQSGGGEHPTRVQGWWKAPAGECTTVGTFPDPGFLIHLRSSRGVTATFKERPSVPLCANLEDAFTSTVASLKEATKPCPPGQTSVMFQMFVVGQARTYTLTLDP